MTAMTVVRFSCKYVTSLHSQTGEEHIMEGHGQEIPIFQHTIGSDELQE